VFNLKCVRHAHLAIILSLTIVGGCRNNDKELTANANTATKPAVASQVVIKGSVAKTFTPEEVSAFRLSDHVAINIVEKFPCGVSIQFPKDLKPGTYPIEDHFHSPFAKLFVEYSADCGHTGIFMSTKGSLTLTTAGTLFSGKYEFIATLSNDDSKQINVSGTFSDVVLP